MASQRNLLYIKPTLTARSSHQLPDTEGQSASSRSHEYTTGRGMIWVWDLGLADSRGYCRIAISMFELTHQHASVSRES